MHVVIILFFHGKHFIRKFFYRVENNSPSFLKREVHQESLAACCCTGKERIIAITQFGLGERTLKSKIIKELTMCSLYEQPSLNMKAKQLNLYSSY